MSTQAKNIAVTITPTGGTAQTIASKVYNITTPNSKIPLIDDTNLTSTYKEQIPSDLTEFGELKIEAPWDGADISTIGLKGTVAIVFSCFSPAVTESFIGVITELGEVKAERDKTMRQTVTIAKLAPAS